MKSFVFKNSRVSHPNPSLLTLFEIILRLPGNFFRQLHSHIENPHLYVLLRSRETRDHAKMRERETVREVLESMDNGETKGREDGQSYWKERSAEETNLPSHFSVVSHGSAEDPEIL